MTFLVNPYRYSVSGVAPEAPKIVAPLMQVWPGSNYGTKYRSGTRTGILSDTRTSSGSVALSFANPITSYWGIFEIGDTGGTSNTDPFLLAIRGVAPYDLFMAHRKPAAGDLFAHTLSNSASVCDGGIYRIAWNLDLDDIAGSEYRVNGTSYAFTYSPAADNINWSGAMHWCCQGRMSGSSPTGAVAGDGVALMSFSNLNDLDLDTVYDSSGFFTDPGYHFLNWYASRPPAAFFNAPYFNQGYVSEMGGMNFNYATPDYWGQIASSNYRAMTTVTAPYAGTEMNAGITY